MKFEQALEQYRAGATISRPNGTAYVGSVPIADLIAEDWFVVSDTPESLPTAPTQPQSVEPEVKLTPTEWKVMHALLALKDKSGTRRDIVRSADQLGYPVHPGSFYCMAQSLKYKGAITVNQRHVEDWIMLNVFTATPEGVLLYDNF